jgi:beta-glucosidase
MPPNLGVSDAALVAALRAGTLSEKTLDLAVTRVLHLADQVRDGQSAPPPPQLDLDAHHALARAAASECAVLLKNDNNILPLRADIGDVIAVIGDFAHTPRYQGGGSSHVSPTRVDTALDELRRLLPEGVEITYSPGFGIGSTDRDDALAAEAVALAGRASVTIVFLGLPDDDESEGQDRTHMKLPTNQTALLAQVATKNPQIVVVLANGSAVEVSAWEHHACAILETWLSGQASGGAVADLLLGITNPSGKLAETLPLRLQDNPSFLNFPGDSGHVRYGEGLFLGYRGYDAAGQAVSHPFGHGLSYTTFDYRDLATKVIGTAVDGDLTIAVTCTVTNTGARPGHETVQLYVGDLQASVARPVRELKAFTKIYLEPGRSTSVSFSLCARDLSYWSTTESCWQLEAGAFEISIGASSRDLRLISRVDVPAPPLPTRLDEMSTLREWLADPDGCVALRAAVGADADGQPRGILGNETMMTVIGDFPIASLATFPGIGITNSIVNEIVSRFAEKA